MLPVLEPEPRHLPKSRSECADGERPCPYVACRHHLYLDVNEVTGSLKLNFPDLEPEHLFQSCSLDVAECGGATLEEIGMYLNMTRERVRQLELIILDKLRAEAEKLRDALD